MATAPAFSFRSFMIIFYFMSQVHAAYIVFQDDFSGPNVDAAKWNQHYELSASILQANGVLNELGTCYVASVPSFARTYQSDPLVVQFDVVATQFNAMNPGLGDAAFSGTYD